MHLSKTGHGDVDHFFVLDALMQQGCVAVTPGSIMHATNMRRQASVLLHIATYLNSACYLHNYKWRTAAYTQG